MQLDSKLAGGPGDAAQARAEACALRLVESASGAILYEPSRIDHPTGSDFDAAELARAGRIERAAGGRGSAWFVAPRAPGEPALVLRHYRRGGLIARLVTDLYAWPGAARVRSFRELRLLAELERLGLPAARPVAAHYVRSGLAYRADLLTLAIPGARTLAQRVGPDLPDAAWAAVGACIRRFHDAGVCHADLNAHNVLFDAHDAVHLVDFDRGELRAPGAWRRANLARLDRSLQKITRERPGLYRAGHWVALLAGYGAR